MENAGRQTSTLRTIYLGVPGVIHAHIGPSLQRGGGPTLGHFLFYWTRPPSGRINPSALQVQVAAGWCNASVHVFYYGRTSLGALLSIMMNVALKSELLVESWA